MTDLPFEPSQSPTSEIGDESPSVPLANSTDELASQGADEWASAPYVVPASDEDTTANDEANPSFEPTTPVESDDATDTSAAMTPVTTPPYVDEVPLASQGPSRKSTWSSRVTLLLVAALVGGLAGHYASNSNSNSGGGVTVNTDNSSPGGAVLPSGLTIPALVEKVDPSIVSIDVKSGGSEDQGTGMIISRNGYVITNNHVISAAVNSGTITVTRTGSTKALPATLIGTNPIDDVALIKIENVSGLPTVTFGNSNSLVVGDAVVAIGNALGLAAGTPTVTSGIVSALGRTVTAGTSSATETLNNMIQTDAAINPGNSGGPLLDSKGDVIGMNTAVAGTLPDGTSAQNIGFAIPVATIQSLLRQLMAGESVVNHGAFIGVEIMTLTPSIQAQYGFSVSSGAVVMSVIAGTGAAAAGIHQGDIIVGVDSTAITSAQDLSSVLSSHRPGDVVALHIVRGKKHLTINVTLGRQPKG